MAKDVHANGREIACKSGSAQVIAAFPDVCLSPPSPPAGPVPIPYPLFSQASDTTDGSRTITIDGKEVMLRDSSHYKKSQGDEAATKSLGQGVITHTLGGKVYFVSWSMDVVFEDKNVVRHLDMTTSNHASPNGNDEPPWANVENMTVDGHSCKEIVQKIHPYGEADCKKGSESHHIVDNASLTMEGARKVPLKNIISKAAGRAKRNLFQPGSQHPGRNYDEDAAPCICLSGSKSNKRTQHGKAHATTKREATARSSKDGKWTYKDAREAGTKSIQDALKLEDWEAECIGLALDAYYKDKLKMTDNTEVVAPTGKTCTATKFDNGSGTTCTAFELT